MLKGNWGNQMKYKMILEHSNISINVRTIIKLKMQRQFKAKCLHLEKKVTISLGH